MNGPEHYREAERDIEHANRADGDHGMYFLARAQVHATLALAAATASRPSALYTSEYRQATAAAWVEVAG